VSFLLQTGEEKFNYVRIFSKYVLSYFAYVIDLMFMHCRYRCVVAKLVVMQILHCTDPEIICI
jgi:hypothetical protein